MKRDSLPSEIAMQLGRKVAVEVDTCDHEKIERKRKERVFKKGKGLMCKGKQVG